MNSFLLDALSHSPAALDQYRLLRTRLNQSPLHPRVIVVTSACPGDGKSLTAVNLAITLAMRPGTRVALVDADLRRGSLHRLLGLEERPGLVELLRGAPLADALVTVPGHPAISAIPAGTLPANAPELLDSDAWRSLVGSLRESFDFVIIDSPPCGGVADYELIEAVCDGVLMVMRPGHTGRLAFHSALNELTHEKFLGVLINDSKNWLLWQSSNYYYEAAKN